jgi:hypothetical protein
LAVIYVNKQVSDILAVIYVNKQVSDILAVIYVNKQVYKFQKLINRPEMNIAA